MLKVYEREKKKRRQYNVCGVTTRIFIHFVLYILDHWFTKCFYAPTHIRRFSRCLFGHGTYGRQSVPGHTNGFGPWTNVVFIVPNVVRDKASPFSWNNPQGMWWSLFFILFVIFSIRSFINRILTTIAGLETIQYCREIRLHIENIGLWFGSYSRYDIHDDTVCGNKILSSARSNSRHGI